MSVDPSSRGWNEHKHRFDAGSVRAEALAAGSVGDVAIATGGLHNASLATDVARANQLVNGGFEIWQRGNGPFAGNGAYTADRWVIALSGTDTISIIPTSANVDGASKLALQATFTKGTGTNTAVYQQVEDFPQLKGRTVSASVRVWCDTAAAVRLWAYQGGAGGRVYGSVHPGGSTWQTLTITTVVDPAATAPPQVGIEHNAACVARMDNAVLVTGSVAADYVPLPPADDLARCLRYYENSISAGTSSNATLAQAISATNAYGWVSFKVRKAIIPTITFSGTWFTTAATGGQNSATPGAAGTTVDGYQVSATATAGLVAGGASLIGANNGGWWAAEANP